MIFHAKFNVHFVTGEWLLSCSASGDTEFFFLANFGIRTAITNRYKPFCSRTAFHFVEPNWSGGLMFREGASHLHVQTWDKDSNVSSLFFSGAWLLTLKIIAFSDIFGRRYWQALWLKTLLLILVWQCQPWRQKWLTTFHNNQFKHAPDQWFLLKIYKLCFRCCIFTVHGAPLLLIAKLGRAWTPKSRTTNRWAFRFYLCLDFFPPHSLKRETCAIGHGWFFG